MNILKKILSLFNNRTSNIGANVSGEITLEVSSELKNFLESEVLPGLELSASEYWAAFQKIIEDFSPRNEKLLEKRVELQKKIDSWHAERKGSELDSLEYKNFLIEIGYLVPEREDFKINTSDVDLEIKTVAGPQLVVPVMNARFALNAANARWGSLYDALYGTDVISEDGGASKGGAYNIVRGEKVIDFAKKFLDKTIPMEIGEYKDVESFDFSGNELKIYLVDGTKTALRDNEKYVGYAKYEKESFGLLFKNNNLHFEIQVDRSHAIGASDTAGIKDILMESAITTIQDCEDSVAAVDGADKTEVYRNWLGLMKGTLEENFEKNSKIVCRKLAGDRNYSSKSGSSFSLPGRSLMLIRNVGLLMKNPAVKTENGEEIFEGILDAMFTICIAMHDILGNGKYKNSKQGSIYIVKPKMHGPEEVKFTCDLFAQIEEALGLKPNTVKIGIMDEERRTTVNLKECIRAARDRVIFINTGFLDRTGDEIHTSMEAGPMIPKTKMKQQSWISAYEDWNVDVGLEVGFKGSAQIGKGMWPMPDEMLQMFNTKTMHPNAGANCAWVPSPTAASIHAIHYHDISVEQKQTELLRRGRASLDEILNIPTLDNHKSLSLEEINDEINNNCQGILGYVVRWVDQGVGCSKVPDINDIGLMEDRATCRISSQHLANWLHHDICSKEQVMESMKKMAVIVDEQNADDSGYKRMAPDFDGFAFKAACDLVFEGRSQPSGYTEPILHQSRLSFKQNI